MRYDMISPEERNSKKLRKAWVERREEHFEIRKTMHTEYINK